MSEPSSHTAPEPRFLVLFDGDCVLCNAWARFISGRDPRRQFSLGLLQSERGQKLLREHNLPADLQSVVLLWTGGTAVKSDAILRMVAHLAAPWPLVSALRIVPRFLRDFGYDFIARNRYRWFGRGPESCPLPTPEMRARLLD